MVIRLRGLNLPCNSVSRLTDWLRHDLNSVDWAVKPQNNIKSVTTKPKLYSIYQTVAVRLKWIQLFISMKWE